MISLPRDFGDKPKRKCERRRFGTAWRIPWQPVTSINEEGQTIIAIPDFDSGYGTRARSHTEGLTVVCHSQGSTDVRQFWHRSVPSTRIARNPRINVCIREFRAA